MSVHRILPSPVVIPVSSTKEVQLKEHLLVPSWRTGSRLGDLDSITSTTDPTKQSVPPTNHKPPNGGAAAAPFPNSRRGYPNYAPPSTHAASISVGSKEPWGAGVEYVDGRRNAGRRNHHHHHHHHPDTRMVGTRKPTALGYDPAPQPFAAESHEAVHLVEGGGVVLPAATAGTGRSVHRRGNHARRHGGAEEGSTHGARTHRRRGNRGESWRGKEQGQDGKLSEEKGSSHHVEDAIQHAVLLQAPDTPNLKRFCVDLAASAAIMIREILQLPPKRVVQLISLGEGLGERTQEEALPDNGAKGMGAREMSKVGVSPLYLADPAALGRECTATLLLMVDTAQQAHVLKEVLEKTPTFLVGVYQPRSSPAAVTRTSGSSGSSSSSSREPEANRSCVLRLPNLPPAATLPRVVELLSQFPWKPRQVCDVPASEHGGRCMLVTYPSKAHAERVKLFLEQCLVQDELPVHVEYAEYTQVEDPTSTSVQRWDASQRETSSEKSASREWSGGDALADTESPPVVAHEVQQQLREHLQQLTRSTTALGITYQRSTITQDEVNFLKAEAEKLGLDVELSAKQIQVFFRGPNATGSTAKEAPALCFRGSDHWKRVSLQHAQNYLPILNTKGPHDGSTPFSVGRGKPLSM